MTRVVAVIQGRLGSTRLPGKVLMPLGERPMIAQIFRRLKAAGELDEVIIATADNEANRPLVEFARDAGLPVFAGQEEDLIDRFLEAGRAFNADALLRVTADCPFVDPTLVDPMVAVWRRQVGELDFLANNRPSSYPHGMDMEIIAMPALERLWREETDPFKREWFTLNFCDLEGNPQNAYRCRNLPAAGPLPHLRLTVDYPEDMEMARRIFAELDTPDRVFTLDDIIELIDAQPEIARINAMHGGETAADGVARALDESLQEQEKEAS
jgi:spore coat polysaccharide biosynthesis protein SpsF (cytidylyltransferase family)